MLLHANDSQGWLLKALRECGSMLVTELYGLGEDDLRWRPGEGEWSLKEIAAHLRDAEELALAQLNAFLSPRARRLPAWDVDVLPEERDYQGEPVEEFLSSFRSMRRETTYLLWGLTEADWEQRAEHPFRGTVTLAEIAREMAQHDLEHLWQVRRIKAQLKAKVSKGREDW